MILVLRVKASVATFQVCESWDVRMGREREGKEGKRALTDPCNSRRSEESPGLESQSKPVDSALMFVVFFRGEIGIIAIVNAAEALGDRHSRGARRLAWC